MFGSGSILSSMLVFVLNLTTFASPLQQAAENQETPWWLWVLIVAAVVLVLIILWWYLSRRSARAYPTSNRVETGGPESEVAPVPPEGMERTKPKFSPAEPEHRVDATFVEPEPVYDAGPGVIEDETAEPDDLKVIEGIGPRIEALLKGNGITTFTQLAAAKVPNLREMLEEAGLGGISDPTTWPEQATLAAEGRWEALERLQELLDGGRRT